MGSPPGGSILRTSAPISARSCVAYGPGRQIVRSRTRSPASSPPPAATPCSAAGGLLHLLLPGGDERHHVPELAADLLDRVVAGRVAQLVEPLPALAVLG